MSFKVVSHILKMQYSKISLNVTKQVKTTLYSSYDHFDLQGCQLKLNFALISKWVWHHQWVMNHPKIFIIFIFDYFIWVFSETWYNFKRFKTSQVGCRGTLFWGASRIVNVVGASWIVNVVGAIINCQCCRGYH